MFASAPNAAIPNASSGSLQINTGGPMASYPNAAAPVAGRLGDAGIFPPAPPPSMELFTVSGPGVEMLFPNYGVSVPEHEVSFPYKVVRRTA